VARIERLPVFASEPLPDFFPPLSALLAKLVEDYGAKPVGIAAEPGPMACGAVAAPT